MPTTLESATASKSHNALTAKWACLWLNLMVANEDKLDITISNEFKLCQTAKAVGLRPSDVLVRLSCTISASYSLTRRIQDPAGCRLSSS